MIAALTVVLDIGDPDPARCLLRQRLKRSWQEDWDKTVKAAEQEGQVVLYSLSEIGDAIANTGFQKKFPKIKISVVAARGGEHVSRVSWPSGRAGKFLADVGNLGNTSPYTLYQSKALDPIASAFILPEVKDESKWWQGKQQFIDPEGKFILVYVGAPLFLVGYNTKLVDPGGFKSYWDLLDPKWKGKIVVFDPKAGGFAATRDRFFYHNPELGPLFLRRLFSEMAPTLVCPLSARRRLARRGQVFSFACAATSR